MELQDRSQPELFISYRAADRSAAAAAVVLAERLRQDLGDSRVYFAPRDNELTRDWAAELKRRLSRVTLLIAVIGPDWETGGTGASRLQDRNDWVRFEVAHALASESTDVMPVLVDRSRSPHANSLPESIRDIATIHGMADFDVEQDYQLVLMQAWASLHGHHPNTVLAVSDATAKGTASVARLVDELKVEGLVDLDRLRLLSQTITSPPGATVIPLRAASEEFPTVLLVEPDTFSEHWQRRRAAMAAWVARHPDKALQLIAAGGSGTLLATTASALDVSRHGASWTRRLVNAWHNMAATAKAATAAGAAAVTIGVTALVVTLANSSSAALSSYEGVWEGDWGVHVIEVVGDELHVAYEHDQGVIALRAVGTGQLNGWWLEDLDPDDTGRVEFTVVDESSLEGIWDYGDVTPTSGSWSISRNKDMRAPPELVARLARRQLFDGLWKP